MKKFLLCAVLLSGCATQSGVIPEGKDAYLLIMSSGYGLAYAGDLKVRAHREANTFCSKLGKRPETVTEKTTQSGAVSDFHEEELKFRCVAEANAAPPPVPTAVPASSVPAASAVSSASAASH